MNPKDEYRADLSGTPKETYDRGWWRGFLEGVRRCSGTFGTCEWGINSETADWCQSKWDGLNGPNLMKFMASLTDEERASLGIPRKLGNSDRP